MVGNVSPRQSNNEQPKPLMRSRTGCLTCRRRKKKCDEICPSCTGCQRLNLECQWESSTSMVRVRRRQRNSKCLLPGQEHGMVHVFSILTPDVVSRLLSHFFNASPRWFSTRVGSRRTDYLKLISPTISESILILDCILAIASADLLKYSRCDREMRYIAGEYYGRAVCGLRNAIETEIMSEPPSNALLSDCTPLAVLLLCVHETQNFTDRERILPHLNAAVFLLQNRTPYGAKNSVLRSYLIEVFCYFFALASFSLGPKLLFQRAHAIFDSLSLTRNIRDGHIMRASQNSFIAIYRVSGLAQSLVSHNSQEVTKAREQLLQLDKKLSSQVEYDESQTLDLESLNDIITSELYRLACIIHVRKLLFPSVLDGDNSIISLVETFIARLQLLPADSPSHGILSWPLVVSGFSASDEKHQRIIATKLGQIYDEWRSDIFSKAAEYLRQRWKQKKKSKHTSPLVSVEPEGVSRDAILAWHECPVILA